MTTIEIFINTDVNGFFFFLYPVKIKVKDCLSFTISILVYQGKRWAGDIFGDIQGLANSFNESGFPGSHCSIKGNNSFWPAGINELPGCLWQFLKRMNNNIIELLHCAESTEK